MSLSSIIRLEGLLLQPIQAEQKHVSGMQLIPATGYWIDRVVCR